MDGNGTKNRHLIASLIGTMPLSPADSQLVYEFFGHSEHVNHNIYQRPQAERQLAVTGRILSDIYNKGL